MTDVPRSYDENDFPALDGLDNCSNLNINNNINIASNNNLTQLNTNNSNNIIPTGRSSNSWSPSNRTNNANSLQLHNQPSATGQQQQTKLNYLLLAGSQPNHHVYQQQQPPQPKPRPQQQQQPQQVLDQLVDSNRSSNAMVSQYHLQQPQQPQSILDQSINNNNNILNNNNNNNMMQNSSSSQHPKGRQGLPNPILNSERCCTFKIAPEERRHRDFEMEQSKILKEIMQKTNSKIEVTTTKDGALNFCIIGKEQSLKLAKNLVLNDFQTSVTLTVSVPKSIHGRLLGPKGARLASIQDETQTKIAIPRKEEDSDIIKIVGLKSNAEMAVLSIQKYAREFAGKTVEKVTVERNYLLFITGPLNENLKRWEEMGAKVSTSGGLLPNSNDRESGQAEKITFTIIGEATAVAQVKDEIQQVYEDKKKKCVTVNIEVKKAQHKYILGPGGQNLRSLFAKTGVSVELPHESDSETVTLRGERSKMASALSELYNQAHSETDEFLEVESWLHKYLIGARKSFFLDFKARGVDVKSFDDKIKLHGPPSEVENIRDVLEAELVNVKKTIIRKDIRVEPRIHGYIIGKAGATVDQIREESGAFVLVPKNDEPSEFITLEGTAEAVAIAEDKINAIAKRYEASRKLVIDQQLHGSIIGRGGEKIRSIREKFSQVVFTFPEQGSKNNEITILGPTDEVEECYKYLDELHQQLQESNHQVKVPIKSDIIKHLPDARAALKRIKNDHRVKIDLVLSKDGPVQSQVNSKQAPTSNGIASTEDISSEEKKKQASSKTKGNKKQQSEATKQTNGVSPSGKQPGDNSKVAKSENFALVIGKKEDVDLAKTKVSKLFEELSTMTEIEVEISHKVRSFLDPRTKTYKQFLDDFQNKIVVTFPPVQKQEKHAKAGEDPSYNNLSESNGTSTSNNNKKDNNASRIEVVRIRGPKNIAKKAEKSFQALVVECQEKVDKNYQTQIMVDTAIIDKLLSSDKARLGKIRETNSVRLSIPDRRDSDQSNCVIVGYEKNVQAAAQQFNKLIKDVEERTEETIEIPSQFHPRLIGAGGRNVKKIMEDYSVEVKFARQGEPNPNSVTLQGKPSSILAAKTRMLKQANQYLQASQIKV